MATTLSPLNFRPVLLRQVALLALWLVTALQTSAASEPPQIPPGLFVTQLLGIPLPNEPLPPYLGSDPDLEPGFPVQAYHGPGTYRGGPAVHTLVGNIDGDPTLEILVTALSQGPLYAWNADGSLVPGWPVATIPGAAYIGLGELLASHPGLEIFSGNMAAGASDSDKLAAFTGSGTLLPGWPRTAANYVSAPPGLADVNGDGLDEIFIGEEDYDLHGYRASGSNLTGWPRSGSGGQSRHTPAIADLDQDGDLEILTGTGSVTEGVHVHAYHHTGPNVAGWPLGYPQYGHPDTFIAVGDVDGDGAPEVVFVTKSLVRIVAGNGVVERTLSPSGIIPYGVAPVLADLDGDSFPEIIIQTENYVNIWYGDGTPFPGWPISGTGGEGNTAPVVGDIDGDYLPEIVIANGSVKAYRLDGTMHPHFPKALPMGAGAVPAIADIDLDGRNELIVSGSYWNGIPGNYDKVWVYDLGGPPHGPILWGQFGNDERHQGYAATTIPISGLVATNNSPVPAGEPVTLTATTITGNNLHFAWDFGDGQTGGGSSISHSYAEPGPYTAVVTASNSIGFVTATTTIFFQEEAIAGLVATNNSPTALGQPTTLTANVTNGSNVVYTWDFGDGAAGAGAAVQHVYPDTGLYTATVTATNPLNQATAATTIQVEAAIAGLTAANDGPTALGETTTLSATLTTGSNVVYEWDFGDGNIASGPTVNHLYLAPGVYTATVTASNPVSSQTAATLVLVAEPIANLTAANDSPTVLGSPTHFTATVTAGSSVNYTWNFGDGLTGQGASPIHTYAATGIYTAVVTATNPVSLLTTTTTVVIADEAVAGLVATNDSPTVLGQPTTLTATITAGSNVTYAWDFGDGATATGPTVNHLYLAPGVYSATITASNTVSLLTATTPIIVEETIAGLAATSDSPTELGEPTTLTATVTAGSNVLYTWDLGDGNLGSGAVLTHTYAAIGTYTATITATNLVSQDTNTTVITVVEGITGLAATNDSSTPLGQPTTFTATVAAGDQPQFTWDFGDGQTSSGPIVNHTYTAAGVYTATVTAANPVSVMTTTTQVHIVTPTYHLYLPVVTAAPPQNARPAEVTGESQHLSRLQPFCLSKFESRQTEMLRSLL